MARSSIAPPLRCQRSAAYQGRAPDNRRPPETCRKLAGVVLRNWPGTMLSMMNRLRKFTVGLLGLLVAGSVAMARAPGTDDVAQGRALYLQYCASCHGRNADGNGPVAPALSTPPANLHLLWERYGNPLPDDQIARFIDGRADVKAHGPRDMPVWGEVWQNPKGRGSENRVKERISKLVAYLQSIQKTAQTALAQ